MMIRVPLTMHGMAPVQLDGLLERRESATSFLKALSHEGRLSILCHLASGEKSVTQLEELLAARQAAVSQQLARLRNEGFVSPRRDGKTIYYSISDDRLPMILELLDTLLGMDTGAQDV